MNTALELIDAYSYEETESFFRLLHGDTLAEEAKTERRDRDKSIVKEFDNYRAWCAIGYVKEAGTKDIDMSKSTCVRTYKSLMHHSQNELAVFFAPNTSCSRSVHNKRISHLRWISTIACDIDEVIELEEVLKRISSAGLPKPTAINKTPNGWHVYWFLKKRIEGWKKSNQAFYRKVANAIQVSLNADPCAKSASNYYRIPKDLQYFVPENRFTVLKFENWLKKQSSSAPVTSFNTTTNMLEESAVQKLLKGVNNGSRNTAAFVLAKIYQYMDYSVEEARSALSNWNTKNVPSLAPGQLNSRVNSAYSGDKFLPLNMIYDLTGERVNLGGHLGFRKHKKERAQRDRYHFDEILADLILFLKSNNGVYEGSQLNLTKALTKHSGFEIKERSLKEVIKQLKNADISREIVVTIIGKGRGSKTIIELKSEDDNKEQALDVENNEQKKCTTNVVQITKNFKQKITSKFKNKTASTPATPKGMAKKRLEEETVQSANNHSGGWWARLKNSRQASASNRVINISTKSTVKALTVDTVDPCGYVGNPHPPGGNKDEKE